MVSDKYSIVIQDACILFDLVDLTLLGDFFQLGFSAFTTPQIVSEITNKLHKRKIEPYLKNGKLKIDSYGSYESISAIFEKYPGLSFADCSVLELAIRKEAIIFSSDGSLRKISTRKKLIVKGTLWIIEELYYKNIITREFAIEKLNLYYSVNQRAPKKEIEALISKLRKPF